MRTRCLGCMSEYESSYGICPFCGYDPQETPGNSLHMKPGELLYGRYLIGKALGSGGFGITYVGWDFTMARKVAIKEYLPSEFATRALGETQVTIYSGNKGEQYQSGLEKFVEEAQRLSKFQNTDGIVQVYDAFKENNTAYIVMEFLDGETLASYLEHNGKIPVDEAVEMLKPAMYALESVHKAGIIHRDIAPDNIFLTKDGGVKVIDFGASRYATTSHSRSLTVMIKQGYSPEEQYRSRGDQGPHTDVYALGAVLYKMITGITPPDAMERRAYFESENKDVLIPPSKNCKIDRNRENAILNAMNVRIEDRTKTIADFLAELESDKPVKRVSGKIRAFDRMRWPLWAKIGLPAAGVVALVLLALLITGRIGVMDTLNRTAVFGENSARVADVSNQSLGVAQAMLYEDGIESIAAEYLPYDNIATNIVIEQDYSAGTVVEKGTVVSLYLSNQTETLQGSEEGVMPSVLYQSLEEAEALLEASGISYHVTEVDSLYAEGTVIWASLLEGETAGENETVEMVVSTGEGETESLSANLPATSLYVGDSIQLVAENAVDSGEWSSSDETVAAVDQNGQVTAQGEGTVVITVTSGGEAAACYLSVYDYSIQIKTESIGIFTDGTATITVYGAPGGTTFEWNSSDEAVASVRNGAITGVSDGEALVTANCTINGRTYTTDPIRVRVASNGIILSEYDISGFYVGDQAELTTETKTEDQEIQWESDNPDVASVQDGVITAVGEGTAQITAKLGEYKAVCSVTVTEPRVKISATKNSFTVDDTLTLNATTLPTDQEVSWSSSDASICTVDENGVVTAVSAGETMIIADFTYKEVEYTGSFNIQVTDRVILSSQAVSLVVGGTETLIATTEPSDQSVTWSSSDTDVATVTAGGIVTGVKEGTANISASVTVGDKSYTAICKVTVAVPSIKMAQTEISMYIGDSSSLTAEVSPSGQSVSFSSSNQSAVLVSDTGVLTAVGSGTATITALMSVSGNNYSTSCIVTVIEPIISISLSDYSLMVGDYTNLAYSIEGNWTSKSLSSNNTNVAVVSETSEGLASVAAVGAGSATLTLTITLYGVEYSASCTITVTEPSINLSSSALSMYIGDSDTLSATVTPSGQTVTWSSSNTAVATVNSSGVVTAVSDGSATITATIAGTNYSSACSVTVEMLKSTLHFSEMQLPSGNVSLESISVGGTVSSNYPIYDISVILNDLEPDIHTVIGTIASPGSSTYVYDLTNVLDDIMDCVTYSSTFTIEIEVTDSSGMTVTYSTTFKTKSTSSSSSSGGLSSTTLSLKVGETGWLSATSDGSAEVLWISSDETVATVSGSSFSTTVTAVGTGTAVISAYTVGWSTDYLYGTCTVTVTD